ncbi:hypothetical protein ABZ915_37530 [Streptomyces sp. NPDC046915]
MSASHLFRGLFATLAAVLVLGGAASPATVDTHLQVVAAGSDSLIWG